MHERPLSSVAAAGSRRSGFTLIEALVFLMLFSIVSAAFYQTWELGTNHIMNAKGRLGAINVANQKMEIVRGMTYDDIGTQGGVPDGILEEDETVTANRKPYYVHTTVQYIDDAFDGTVGSGDGTPTDYKRVYIEVSWGDRTVNERTMLVGIFSPDGLESASNTGVLSINILDPTGSGVSGASVRVTCAATGVDLTTTTDTLGNILLPGTPPAVQGYHLAVSKSGFYSASTYPPYPTTSFEPTDLDGSVAIDSLNRMTLIMGEETDIRIHTVDPFGNDVPNYSFSLTGGRQLGTIVGSDPTAYEYSYTDTVSTDGDGEFSVEDESYGLYTVDPDASETGHVLLRITPETDVNNVFDAAAGESNEVSVVLADKSVSSLLVTVTDDGTGSPLEGASVHVTNTLAGYDGTVTTDRFGQAYFPTAAPGLVAGDYDVEVSLSGYDTESDTDSISGTSLETMSVTLDPS